MYRDEGVAAIRRIQGMLSLAKKYGAALADDACAAALESGVHSNPYRFVRRYLERRPQLTLLRQVDPLIRQLTLYRDLHRRQNHRRTHHEPHRTANAPYANSGSAAWPPCWKPACVRPRPSRWRPSI